MGKRTSGKHRGTTRNINGNRKKIEDDDENWHTKYETEKEEKRTAEKATQTDPEIIEIEKKSNKRKQEIEQSTNKKVRKWIPVVWDL